MKYGVDTILIIITIVMENNICNPGVIFKCFKNFVDDLKYDCRLATR